MSQPADSDYPPPQPTPFVRLARGQEVSLGCGTLILIALIVAVCSGGVGRTDLTPVLNRLNDLDRRMQQLEKKIDDLQNQPRQK